MPTLTSECLRLRRVIHGDLSFFLPADWQTRVSGPACLFTIPGWENKGFAQILLHRDCTHRGEGAAILREVEAFAQSQSVDLARRRGPTRLAAAAGGGPVFVYEWDMQQGLTTGAARVFLVELSGLGLVELNAFGNGRLMGHLEEVLPQIAGSVGHRSLHIDANETAAVRAWRVRLTGRTLERVNSFYQSMNGGIMSSEQYLLSGDGTYRHTVLRSASFQRLGGFSNQSEERGTWRLESAGEAVFLALTSTQGHARNLTLAEGAQGLLLDHTRFAVR